MLLRAVLRNRYFGAGLLCGFRSLVMAKSLPISSFERTKFRNSVFSSGDEKGTWLAMQISRTHARWYSSVILTPALTSFYFPNDLGNKEPGHWIIGGQEFDNAEPVLLVLPERLEIVFVLRSQDRQITFFQSFASDSQYTDDTQSVRSFVLPTAIYRALRCDRCLVITT